VLTIAIAILVFFATAVLDVVQAYAFEAYQKRDPNRTSLLSIVEYGITLFTFYAFIEHSWWFAVPEIAGLVVGSQISVRRIRAAERKSALQVGMPVASTTDRGMMIAHGRHPDRSWDPSPGTTPS